MKQNIIAIIPARMGSSRFYGKPMQKINGIPMIERIYKILSKVNILKMVVVATCDKEIFNHIKGIDGNVVMTKKSHTRASDRCAEAIKIVEKTEKLFFDIVIMVQGDEPMVNAEMVLEAVQPMLYDDSILVTNLLGVIESVTEFEDRNCIKVVCDVNNDAIYFSREPIPTKSKQSNVPMRKQVCVIPFRRDYLIQYTQMQPTPLEIIESIDMLRIIENGQKVRMVPTNHKSFSVDTPDDLIRVEKMMAEIAGN